MMLYLFLGSFVVGLDFRAISNDGILLYATDNETHPTQFFSLELARGRLVYKFDSGKGLVSISTTNKYSGKGSWHRVSICYYRMINKPLLKSCKRF